MEDLLITKAVDLRKEPECLMRVQRKAVNVVTYSITPSSSQETVLSKSSIAAVVIILLSCRTHFRGYDLRRLSEL